ncbi:MAG: hypothetical protein ACYC0H_15465, partial [Solirubrobacteraceae bacterium]
MLELTRNISPAAVDATAAGPPAPIDATAAGPPAPTAHPTLLHVFDETVSRWPDRIALDAPDRQMTYAEL